MIFGEHARSAGRTLKALGLAAALAFAPAALAAAPAATTPAPVVAAPVAPAPVVTTPAVEAPVVALTPAEAARTAIAPGGYVPMKPTAGKGMPIDGGYGFQTQYSPNGDYALWMHDKVLMPLIVVITLFVLALLLWVMFRYRKGRNPVPSKTSHNTLIEIVWTGLPIIILLLVFVPSMKLLGRQYAPAPAKALTVKATGNQWFWTYSYPDNGGFEVISNMLPDEAAIKNGEPPQLAADLRMVVPAGEPIRLQTTGADVIHAFAVPSLWFKLDAVPGRINEKVLFIKEPGVYYGQCSELCGARHGYMPIVVEALPRDKFNAWVMTQSGGAIDGLPKPVEAAPAPAAATSAAAPAPAPSASAAPAA
ncbi:MAG TPA: cytochrome c oxidase subunit II [Novosphingobium sp.]|nr:cytochrome c oxidase subunit II [Novosphingobium sp.]